MAFQSIQDWQLTKKTVLERNSHMFNNPLMSDIKLTCGESKRIKCFYAHKYVLATSSPVFYAMFYGDLAEKNPVVHLEDADEESLGEFLRFLYTDECTLTPEITVKVMYLGKKYIIPSLTDKCVKVLHDSMNPVNVVTVLEQALYFDENELEEKCWEMVDQQTSEAVTSDAFSDINQTTLITILKRDTLKIKEIELFQAVLKWSESELSRKGLEITGMNKRAVLGDAIYQIRFLLMSQKEFTQYVASQSGLLTTEEIVPIYQSFTGFNVPSLRWNLPTRRQREVLRCRRFVKRVNCIKDGSAGSSHSLSFRVNKPCMFHGVCLFAEKNANKYDVTLEVKNARVNGTFTPEMKNKYPAIYGYDVMLSTHISIKKNEVVTMVATIQGLTMCSWAGAQTSIQLGGATVTFINSTRSSNDTNVDEGQFYEIILSI